MTELPNLSDDEQKDFEAWKIRFDVETAVEMFEERAAIMEYEGNLSRVEAEDRALLDVVRNI